MASPTKTSEPLGWKAKKLWQLLTYEQPTPFIVEGPIRDQGEIPVLTAGKTFVLGYTNEATGRYLDTPAIVFDDFTTSSQWADTPFKVKSSASKILSNVDGESDLRFMFALIRSLQMNPSDHKRHWISVFQEIEVIVPSFHEQSVIAAALSDAAAWVESLEALIAKKRDVFEGMRQMLLTGTQRLPGFHENWGERRLGEIGIFVRGSGITKSQVTARGIPCVRYGELYTLHRYFIRKFGSFVQEHVASSATPIRRGDLLSATSGETKEDIGPTAVVDSDEHAVAGGDLVIFRTTKAEPTFLAYLLNSHDVQMQKAKVAKGDAVVHIYTADLNGLLLDLPELVEQRAIAAALTDASTEIDNLVAEREKAELIRQGMAQDLLTGKVRLV